MAGYSFYQNKDCEFFPCHRGADPENFNCLFCYCPLYALADRCGGHFHYTKDGIKDCSGCIRPHQRERYEEILSYMEGIMDLAKKKTNSGQIP